MPPSFDTLCVFGCLCYAYDYQSKRDKFMSRSRKCIFVGYPQGKKGWKLYDLETHDYFVYRDVKFYETEFPFTNNSSSSPHTHEVAHNLDYPGDAFMYDHCGFDGVSKRGRISEHSTPAHENSIISCTESNCSLREEVVATPTVVHNQGLREEVVATPIILDNEERGKGKRIRYTPTKLRGFVTHIVRKVSLSSSSSPTSTQISGMPYPIAHFVSYDLFSVGHKNFLAAVSTGSGLEGSYAKRNSSFGGQWNLECEYSSSWEESSW